MPSTSPAQRRLMAGACKGSIKGKVPKKVACEFHAADKAKARRRRRKKKKG